MLRRGFLLGIYEAGTYKTGTKKAPGGKSSGALILLAERVGFEPTVAHHHT